MSESFSHHSRSHQQISIQILSTSTVNSSSSAKKQQQEPNRDDDCFFEFLIIGGGIAGVVCAETLCSLLGPGLFQTPDDDLYKTLTWRVALISASETVKTTVNFNRVTSLASSFDVVDKPARDWIASTAASDDDGTPSLTVLNDTIERLDTDKRLVYTRKRGPDHPIRYSQLCLATGGQPRLIDPSHPRVLTLRDTESIEEFQSRLKDTRRLVLVGNGGIATEVAHELANCQVVWAVKDDSISANFIDPGAARFLLNARLDGEKKAPATREPTRRRMHYVVTGAGGDRKRTLEMVPVGGKGAAVGPDWAHGRDLIGSLVSQSGKSDLHIVYNVLVDSLLDSRSSVDKLGDKITLIEPFNDDSTTNTDCWPVYVRLSNNQVIGCDLVVSAIGIDACLGQSSQISHTSVVFGAPGFDTAPGRLGESCSGGLLVDQRMATNIDHVYAAGDCVQANWTFSPHWMQMRLWSQARLMGYQAAKSMFARQQGDPEAPLDFSFEIFTHVTYFFDFKVVLLGLFNGQGLDLTASNCYALLRVTPGLEYVKCLMVDGRMQGAVLIGETDLEETLENLIMNQIDLTSLEDNLLDPNLDLTDYFD